MTERKKPSTIFKKGDPRINRAGRPKGLTRAAKIAKELNQIDKHNRSKKTIKDIVLVDAEDNRTSRQIFCQHITVNDLAKLVVRLALKGDKEMIKLACEYVFGKPTQRIETKDESSIPRSIEVAFISAAEEVKEEIISKEKKNDE